MGAEQGQKEAMGLGDRIERIVGGLFVTALAVALLAFTHYIDARERDARGWPEVPCTILGTATVQEKHGTAPHTHTVQILRIRYRYEWNGVAHESDRFSTNENGPTVDRASEREHWKSIYRPGGTSTCRVNPADPEDAVLHEMQTSSTPFYCAGGIALAFGLWRLASPWLRRRERNDADARRRPEPQPPPNPRRYRLWFGAAFLAAGLLFAALGALWLRREAADPRIVSPCARVSPLAGPWLFTGMGALFAVIGAATMLFAAIRPKRFSADELPRTGALRRAWATDRFTATLATAVAAVAMTAIFQRVIPRDEVVPRYFMLPFFLLFAAGAAGATLWFAVRFLFARRYEIGWENGPMVPGRPFRIVYRMRDDGRAALSGVRFVLVGRAWEAWRGDRSRGVSAGETVKQDVHLPVRPDEMRRGAFDLVIPASVPPPGADEPAWTLRVRAKVRGGLPVSDDYPLRPVAAPAFEAGVSLGSNLGDRAANLREAVRRLAETPGVRLLARSSDWETEPVDVPPEFADRPYLNAVAVFETTLPLEAWSARCHEVERELGRVRTGWHHPRTIDVDLLYYGDAVRDEPHLRLPHPQIASRRFVCAPLAEVRPALRLPGLPGAVADLLAALPERPAAARLPS